MVDVGEKTKNIWALMKEKKWRYIWTTALAAEFVALRLAPVRFKPDAILAGLPVYHIQREGHAASDELLKYRSMGTLFLAHQKGGKRTFKCTLKIQGPARLYVLSFLQNLQKTGIQENLSIWDFSQSNSLDIIKSETEFTSPTTNAKIRYMEGYRPIGLEQIAYHKTFPIITDTKIYTNMYLETLRYVEDIKVGVDVMEIDCAFREFIPPMHVIWYEGNEEKKKKGYFSAFITDDERDALRRIDLLFNVSWAMRRWFADMQDLEQKQINQYTIEGAVLAFGAMLGVATIGGG